MITFSLASPKDRAAGLHIAKRSALRKFYAAADVEALMSMTPEARPDMALNFVAERRTRFHGSFDFGKRKLYQALVGSGGTHGKKGPKIICTYAIVHKDSGMAYVGSTQDFFKRWRKHLSLLRADGHKNSLLQSLFKSAGEDAFTMKIIQHYDTVDGLMDNEVEASLKFKELLNLRVGNQYVEGWYEHANWGRNYVPKKLRRPNTKSRWFDFIGESRNSTRH